MITPGGRAVQRSQPAEGTRLAEQRTRSAEVSTEHLTEHQTVRKNKVHIGRENAANPREVGRPVQKVDETYIDTLGAYRDLWRRWKRDREEVRMTSNTALGVCRDLCRRWKREEVRTSGINQ